MPSALELLQTPPSPIATGFIVFICALFTFVLVWAYFGWIDIHVVAPGKIQFSGRSKTVQPLESGRITAIYVLNGSSVERGSVLAELDATETSADRESQQRDLMSFKAEIARRRAAVATAADPTLKLATIDFPPEIPPQIRAREQNVLATGILHLGASLDAARAQLAEKRASKERLALNIESRAKLIALTKERVQMREDLEKKGAGSRALVIEAEQQYEQQVVAQTADRGQLLEAEAAIESIERRLAETVAQFTADQTKDLADAERKRDRIEQDLIKAQAKNDRTQLTAPITGTVQQLNITTVGQVVTSGQSLMTIVPLEGAIEVSSLIENKDIGFIEVGQPAAIKVDAFPFTRYGTIDGKVADVSRDAVDESASTSFSDASTATKPRNAANDPQSRAKNLVFPATIAVDKPTIDIDGKTVPLTPGMSVSVEIKTGQRRAIDYVLSPLREVVSKTARER
ncbi:MAG: HlyD family type I secretion periplasmic adaptor subunit [Pseudolabrys sp.]|nr:HlyD family type I secretion periplasmic adaptor subunit [Pseudolabrys sp.]